MEGNLYHLIKARKGRPLAGGLVSHIFAQIVEGLNHIHANGFFHRDMKPENVLVTTTGLFDYTSVSPIAPPNAPKEKDVVAIIKLADFGLARETKSSPPYTEYVSTRWYRAPEVLLRSRDYSNPVDMWALGTIMAELVNLRPLFPGADEGDQVARICEVIGNPSEAYGVDVTGKVIGGGSWAKGERLARAVGFQFPKVCPLVFIIKVSVDIFYHQKEPKDFYGLFEKTIPRSLIDCIRDLLRYDPDRRLTSRQCRDHSYLQETLPRNQITLPSSLFAPAPQRSVPPLASQVNGSQSNPSLVPTPHILPQHHSHSAQNLHFPDASSTHRIPYPIPPFPPGSLPMHHDYRHPNGISELEADYPMASPSEVRPHANGHSDTFDTAMAQDPHPLSTQGAANGQPAATTNGTKPVKRGLLGKKSGKWGLGMFTSETTHHPPLPPVDETSPAIVFPSRKRSQSDGSDSKSIHQQSPVHETPQDPRDAKKNKKEAQRLHREAELEKRKLLERNAREQARAVLLKRQQMLRKTRVDDPEWGAQPKDAFLSKQSLSGPVRREHQEAEHEKRKLLERNARAELLKRQQMLPKNMVDDPEWGAQPTDAIYLSVKREHQNGNVGPRSVGAVAGKFIAQSLNDPYLSPPDRDFRERGPSPPKARRREFDDDHSMSSSDVHSISRMSSTSYATVDSDPGPTRLRNRPSLYGISRMTSRSSLRTSFDDFPPSARSSNSYSLEGQLAHDFRTQASMTSNVPGSVSPPPLQMLSLSPAMSPSLSPSPQWVRSHQNKDDFFARTQSPPFLSISPRFYGSASSPHTPIDVNGRPPSLPPSSHDGSYRYTASSGNTPKSAKSFINPIFKVVSYQAANTNHNDSLTTVLFQPPLPTPPPLPPSTDTTKLPLNSHTLPPFSELEAVAGAGEFSSFPPPLPQFTASGSS